EDLSTEGLLRGAPARRPRRVVAPGNKTPPPTQCIVWTGPLSQPDRTTSRRRALTRASPCRHAGRKPDTPPLGVRCPTAHRAALCSRCTLLRVSKVHRRNKLLGNKEVRLCLSTLLTYTHRLGRAHDLSQSCARPQENVEMLIDLDQFTR